MQLQKIFNSNAGAVWSKVEATSTNRAPSRFKAHLIFQLVTLVTTRFYGNLVYRSRTITNHSCINKIKIRFTCNFLVPGPWILNNTIYQCIFRLQSQKWHWVSCGWALIKEGSKLLWWKDVFHNLIDLFLKDHYFPSISYYFHIPKFFLIFFPHTGKNRNRWKSNLLP